LSAAQQPVSSPAEELILVDDADREIGFCPKEQCHRGEGLLHRAFSVFLFDGTGRLLLQQRSASKPLWPLFWSNSCCSHPRRGETVAVAARRRIHEELGLDSDLAFLFKFRYKARYDDTGAENEICSVFVGRFDGEVRVHPDEIADWTMITPDELTRAIEQDPGRHTPWLKLEWARILRDYPGAIPKAA